LALRALRLCLAERRRARSNTIREELTKRSCDHPLNLLKERLIQWKFIYTGFYFPGGGEFDLAGLMMNKEGETAEDGVNTGDH